MKWFILLILISCGHDSPPAQDTADSDGDQIPNYLESSDELKKYTASVTPFAEMKATLSFKADLKVITVDLSNESDLYKTSYTLLTKRHDLLNKEGHFSEWATLRTSTVVPQLSLPEKAYEVTLRFQDSKEFPDHILLGENLLSDFQPVMKFHLQRKDLEEVLSSKTFLSMRRKGAETPWSQDANVRQRTYRVFWNDGKTTNVYYVSRELTLERFLLLMKVTHPRYVEDEGKLSWHDENKDWWVRDLGNQDKVVVKASEKDIAKEREKNFVKILQEVTRTNGKMTKVTRIEKHPDARLILKLRGTREARTFKEAVRTFKRSGGHEEGPMNCYEWSRSIVSSGSLRLSSEEILNTIKVQSELKAFSSQELAASAIEASDDEGPYLEVALETSDKAIQLTIPDRPYTTYTRTGVYQYECDAIPRKTGGDLTNDEGHFGLRVDAYIEKLED